MRAELANALRITTHPQLRGSWMLYGFDGPVDECPVCATSVLLLHLGTEFYTFDGVVNGWKHSSPGPEKLERLGINWQDIIHDNDVRRLTFAQIADRLEAGAYNL